MFSSPQHICRAQRFAQASRPTSQYFVNPALRIELIREVQIEHDLTPIDEPDKVFPPCTRPVDSFSPGQQCLGNISEYPCPSLVRGSIESDIDVLMDIPDSSVD